MRGHARHSFRRSGWCSNPTAIGAAADGRRLDFTVSTQVAPHQRLQLCGSKGRIELIRERQREGIAIAKAKGVYKGRKKALPPDQVQELVELARSGLPKADLARSYGISRETVYQYIRASA